MNKRTITNLIADCFSHRQSIDLETGFGHEDRYWQTEEYAYYDECMNAAARITQEWPWVAVEVVGSRDYLDCVLYVYPHTTIGPNSAHEHGRFRPGQIMGRPDSVVFRGMI